MPGAPSQRNETDASSPGVQQAEGSGPSPWAATPAQPQLSTPFLLQLPGPPLAAAARSSLKDSNHAGCIRGGGLLQMYGPPFPVSVAPPVRPPVVASRYAAAGAARHSGSGDQSADVFGCVMRTAGRPAVAGPRSSTALASLLGSCCGPSAGWPGENLANDRVDCRHRRRPQGKAPLRDDHPAGRDGALLPTGGLAAGVGLIALAPARSSPAGSGPVLALLASVTPTGPPLRELSGTEPLCWLPSVAGHRRRPCWASPVTGRSQPLFLAWCPGGPRSPAMGQRSPLSLELYALIPPG